MLDSIKSPKHLTKHFQYIKFKTAYPNFISNVKSISILGKKVFLLFSVAFAPNSATMTPIHNTMLIDANSTDNTGTIMQDGISPKASLPASIIADATLSYFLMKNMYISIYIGAAIIIITFRITSMMLYNYLSLNVCLNYCKFSKFNKPYIQIAIKLSIHTY
eukprot:Mrub_02378.p3 GENE.Mrub_02378~~Mrub_02378.p3  ORF type:complete len:162 (+),score=0.91 Mrub_02378:721-1206(+)